MNYKHFLSIAAFALVAFLAFGAHKASAQEYYNPTTYGQFNPYDQSGSTYTYGSQYQDSYQYTPATAYPYSYSYQNQQDPCGIACVPMSLWGTYGYNPTTYGQYNPYAPNGTAWEQQHPQIGNQQYGPSYNYSYGQMYGTQYVSAYSNAYYAPVAPVYYQQTAPQMYSGSTLRGYTTY